MNRTYLERGNFSTRLLMLLATAVALSGCSIKGAIDELTSSTLDATSSKIESLNNDANLIADNQYHEAVKVTLFTASSSPKENTRPELLVQGDGQNEYRCNVSDSQGVAHCSISSDRPGIKLIRLKGLNIRNIVALTFFDHNSEVHPLDPNGNPLPDGVTPVLVGNGQNSTQIQVVIRDGNGNPIAGQTPILQVTGGSGSAQVSCTPSNASGISTCTITDDVSNTPSPIPPIVVHYIFPPMQNGTTINVQAPDLIPIKLRAETHPNGANASTVSNPSARAQVNVMVTDGSGNPVAGQTPVLGINPSSGSSSICSVTNASGLSSCYITSTAVGTKTISVTSPAGITDTLNVVFGAPNTYVPPVTAPADGHTPVAVQIPLIDGSGNPIVGQTPVLNIQPPGSEYVCTPSNASGIATCFITSPNPGTVTIEVTSPAGVQDPDHSVVFTPVTGDNAPHNPATGEDAVHLPIHLVDSNGNPIVGQTPVLDIQPPNGTTYVCTPSNSQGLSDCYITSTTPGDKTVTVTNPAMPGSTTISFDPPTSPPVTTAPADGHSSVTITLDLIVGGSPVANVIPTLSISPSAGTTYSCIPSNSQGRTFCIIESSVPGPKTITVLTPAGVTDTASVNFTSPNDVTEPVPADGVTPLVVPVMLVDGSGNPIVGQTPVLSISPSSAGITYVCTPSDSTGRSMCSIYSTTQGDFTFTVTSPVGVTESFPGHFGDNASPVTGPSSSTIVPADGSSRHVITVNMVNGSGQPAPGTIPQATVSGSGTNRVWCDPANASGVAMCYVTSNTPGTKNVYFQVPFVVSPVPVIFGDSAAAVITDNVPGDGESTGVFTVITRDDNGNIVTGVVPTTNVTGPGQTEVVCTPSDAQGISTCTISADAPGDYTINITEPAGSQQTIQMHFADAWSTFAVTVPQAAANNVAYTSITIKVMASEFMPKVGVTPTVIVTGGGTSVTCSTSNILGDAICQIRSTEWGDKQVRVTNPAISTEATVRFVDVYSSLSETSAGSATSYVNQTMLPVRLNVNVRDYQNMPKAGVVPMLSILNPASATIASTCSISDVSGISTCELTSDTVGNYNVKLSLPFSSAQTQVNFLSQTRACTVASGNGTEQWIGPTFNDFAACGSIVCLPTWTWSAANTRCEENRAPTGGAFQINAGATYTGNPAVNLTVTCPTDESGTVNMTFAENNPTINTGWQACGAGPFPLTLTAGTGNKTVHMRFRDLFGNIATISRTIYLDQTSPIGAAAVVDNMVAGVVGSPNITISVTCPTDPSGTVQMAYGNNPNPNTGWVACTGSVAYVLTNGDGAKQVYFRFRDGAGNVTPSDVIAAVTLDTAGPNSVLSYMDGWLNNSLSFNVTTTPSDTYSAVQSCAVEVSVANLSYGTVGTFGGWGVLAPSSGNGCGVRTFSGQQGRAYRFQTQSNDALGNVGPYFLATQIVKIDLTPPTGGAITIPAQSTSLTIPISVDRGNDTTSGMSSSNADYGIEVRSGAFVSGTCSGLGAYASSGIVATAAGTAYNFIGVNGTCYEFRYSTRNQAGLQSQYVSMNMVKVDITNPVGGSISSPDPYLTNLTVPVTVDRGNDPESGMSNLAVDYKLEVSIAALANDTCGAFSSYSHAGLGETPGSTLYNYPGTQARCYRYRYTVTNGLGLATTYTASTTTKLDITPPVGGAIAVNPRSTTNTFPVTVTLGNDPDTMMRTDDAGYQIVVRTAPFQYGVCQAFGPYVDAQGLLSTTVTPTQTNFNFAGSNGNCYQFQYTYRNRANLSTTATSGVIEVDSSAPLSTAISIATGYRLTTPIVVTVSAGYDPESDMSPLNGDYLLEVQSAVLSNDTCGAYSAWSDAGVSETPAGTSYTYVGVHGQCYQFRYTVTNRFGLTTSVVSGETRIDTTAPASSSIAITEGPRTTVTIPITTNPGNDPESAMMTSNAQYTIEVSSATFSANTCGAFGAWSDAGLNPTASGTNYTFTGVNGTCYQFRYTVTNRATNTTTTQTGITQVDTDAPLGLAISTVTGWKTNLSPVTLTVNPGYDNESGKASAIIHYATAPLSYGTCGAWSAWNNAYLSPTVSGTSYNFSALTDGYCYTFLITMTNNFGLSSTAQTGAFYIDTTAPVIYGPSHPNVTVSAASSYTFTVNYNTGNDAQSALASATLYWASAPYDMFGGCGAWSGWNGWTGVGAGTGALNFTGYSGNCYSFRMVTVNNAGLQSIADSGTSTRIDFTYSWQAGGWYGCTAPQPSWQAGGWYGCTASPYWSCGGWGICYEPYYYAYYGWQLQTCGAGHQQRSCGCAGSSGTEYRSVWCPVNGGTEYRSVWCQRSNGATVADAYCGGGRPADNQGCARNDCPGGAPASAQGCYIGCAGDPGTLQGCDGTANDPAYCSDGGGGGYGGGGK
ncbi:MAG: hypothetical protein KF681_03850 [Bdellovibrionaceae bacterium]|nr:hypothetical protein [Pseudobdellovibrionaceae bacterium]